MIIEELVSYAKKKLYDAYFKAEYQIRNTVVNVGNEGLVFVSNGRWEYISSLYIKELCVPYEQMVLNNYKHLLNEVIVANLKRINNSAISLSDPALITKLDEIIDNHINFHKYDAFVQGLQLSYEAQKQKNYELVYKLIGSNVLEFNNSGHKGQIELGTEQFNINEPEVCKQNIINYMKLNDK